MSKRRGAGPAPIYLCYINFKSETEQINVKLPENMQKYYILLFLTLSVKNHKTWPSDSQNMSYGVKNHFGGLVSKFFKLCSEFWRIQKNIESN